MGRTNDEVRLSTDVRRGWHVLVTGHGWLRVNGADQYHGEVFLSTGSHRYNADVMVVPAATYLLTRNPAEQMAAAMADRDRRRDELVTAYHNRQAARALGARPHPVG